ncbi:PKS-NRPS hybrid synthetase [Fusarium oxysporum f. sp. conglutinans]|nr:PKS-NRPS hybrid synthetase [Fusarium oxysporum f. sp. conglutinans]
MGTILSFTEDCLPPEQEYESRDALFKAINDWAAHRGYAFTTGRSTVEKSGRQTITYTCDRSCRPPSSTRERQRKTTTRGTGCKFSVLAKESLDKSRWTLRHRPDTRFSLHSHPPSQHPSAHPIHRKLPEEDQTQLERLANAGIAPRHIRTYLRQYCNSAATQQDVYNCLAATRRKLCEGQTTIHALANQLDEEGFWSRMQFGSDGRVTAVLFAHPDSLTYLQAYPDILLLDCTYKTNKYGMPLLDMIGVDACQKSFCIAFAFLSGESEDDYGWALDRLRSLYDHHCSKLPSVVLTDRCIACMNAVATSFPTSQSLLCLWHANKAVLRHCLPAFTTRDVASSRSSQPTDKTEEAWGEFYQFWHLIVSSPNEACFKERVARFEQKYLPDHLHEVGYVMHTWLEPYKEKLVKAWVDQHAHFGNTATSRVEGIHALLKSHLKKSTLDLFEAWRAMKQALLNQLSELRSNQIRQQTRFPIELSGSLYSAVRGWVSHEALRKVEEQRRLIGKRDPPPSPICTGTFKKSNGLPCVHTLKDLQERGGVLLLDHFHPHWHLQREGTPQLLLEPRQRIESLAEASSAPKESTRREPSAFEKVQKVARAPSKCTKCGELGHTRTSRTCLLRFEELRRSAGQTPTLMLQPTVVATTGTAQRTSSNDLRENYLAIAETASTVNSSHSPSGEQSPLEECGDMNQGPSSEARPDPQARERKASGVDTWAAQAPRYDSPQAIYQRYIAARNAWYASQPAGSVKTNQQYRRAMGLPLRYDKVSYDWCLDYKQMGGRCVSSRGARDWTKEEMMAYLDWSKAEDDRIEAQVLEVGSDPMRNGRRGVKKIWKRIEEDSETRQARHSAEGQSEGCIVVQL